MPNNVLILFAHGARDPEWARPVQAVAQRLQSQNPHRSIVVAFLEFMTPTLSEAISRITDHADGAAVQVDILPFFIAQGGHLKHDVPELLSEIQQKNKHIALRLLPPLGELPTVQDAMAEAISRLL